MGRRIIIYHPNLPDQTFRLMKNLYAVILLTTVIFIQSPVKSQVTIPDLLKNFKQRPASFACNFFDNTTTYSPPPASEVNDANAEAWMRDIISKISETIGLQNRYFLKARKNYNNCSAICFSNSIGQDRFIQFDRDFLESYQKKTNNRWFVFGVVAHEMGHHLNGHSLDGIGSRPNKELEADEFAGFIMQKMGAPLKDAQHVFSFLNDTEGPPTHPIKKLRYEAVKRGWDKAAGNITLATLRFNDADIQHFALLNLTEARKTKNLQAKLSLINRSLENVPEYAEALSEKGLVFMQLKQFDSAYYYAELAIELEPGIGLLHLNLGKIYYYDKKINDSKQAIEKALRLTPVFPEAYLFLAEVAFDKKDYKDALLQTELALRMNPDNAVLLADILAARAIAFYKTAKYKDAFEYMEAAKELDEKNVRVLLLYNEYKKKAAVK
jgi:tetratricopeptide (TPR) repeat protein